MIRNALPNNALNLSSLFLNLFPFKQTDNDIPNIDDLLLHTVSEYPQGDVSCEEVRLSWYSDPVFIISLSMQKKTHAHTNTHTPTHTHTHAPTHTPTPPTHTWDRRGRDRMVVVKPTTCAIRASYKPEYPPSSGHPHFKVTLTVLISFARDDITSFSQNNISSRLLKCSFSIQFFILSLIFSTNGTSTMCVPVTDSGYIASSLINHSEHACIVLAGIIAIKLSCPSADIIKCTSVGIFGSTAN